MATDVKGRTAALNTQATSNHSAPLINRKASSTKLQRSTKRARTTKEEIKRQKPNNGRKNERKTWKWKKRSPLTNTNIKSKMKSPSPNPYHLKTALNHNNSQKLIEKSLRWKKRDQIGLLMALSGRITIQTKV